jgi:hypothetical protein
LRENSTSSHQQLLHQLEELRPVEREAVQSPGTRRRPQQDETATWRQANENFLITELISATAIKKKDISKRNKVKRIHLIAKYIPPLLTHCHSNAEQVEH